MVALSIDRLTDRLLVYFPRHSISGALALQRSGALALWRSGALALWRSGALALWSSGALELWSSGDLRSGPRLGPPLLGSPRLGPLDSGLLVLALSNDFPTGPPVLARFLLCLLDVFIFVCMHACLTAWMP
jgi:hypothetical protein